MYHLSLMLLASIVLTVASACNAIMDSKVDVESKEDVCAEYCKTIDTYCTDDNRQYRTTEQCLAVCNTFEIGKTKDDEGNTAYCRSNNAAEAEDNPDTYCISSGPGGGGVCGDDCESFCHIQTAVCTGDNRQYPTITECMSECEDFDLSVTYNSDIADGDTFACRLAQLTLAAVDPAKHCPAIAPDSPVCQ
jgi:hypothetical protein